MNAHPVCVATDAGHASTPAPDDTSAALRAWAAAEVDQVAAELEAVTWCVVRAAVLERAQRGPA